MSALEQLAAWWAALVTALNTWWFAPAAVVIGLAMLVVTRLGIDSGPLVVGCRAAMSRCHLVPWRWRSAAW